jgi:hypothetical protein
VSTFKENVMPEEQERPGWLQKIMEFPQRNLESPDSIGAQARALGREAVKDIRSTIMETFYGSPELGGEPGTPLNPTPQQVTKDLGNVYGSYQEMIQDAASRGAGKGQDKGLER